MVVVNGKGMVTRGWELKWGLQKGFCKPQSEFAPKGNALVRQMQILLQQLESKDISCCMRTWIACVLELELVLVLIRVISFALIELCWFILAIIQEHRAVLNKFIVLLKIVKISSFLFCLSCVGSENPWTKPNRVVYMTAHINGIIMMSHMQIRISLFFSLFNYIDEAFFSCLWYITTSLAGSRVYSSILGVWG